MSNLVEAFLIVEQPRQRLSHWSRSLAPLDEDRVPAIAAIEAFYDQDADQALLAVRYEARVLRPGGLGFVVEIALLAEIGLIQPTELTIGDRQRFIGERLARCSITVGDQRTVVGALTELVRRVREHKQRAGRPAVRAHMDPRGTADDTVLTITPKSTRDDLPAVRPPDALSAVRATRDEIAFPAPAKPRTISPHVIQREPFAHRAETVQLAPIELQRMLEATTPPEAAVSRTMTDPALMDAMPPDAQLPAGIIYARYLRSGRWVPVRIGALSLKGATLMSGALPRIQDRVDVALAFASHRALVRGLVHKVSTSDEAALTGTPQFAVSFELDLTSRHLLTVLLTAARDAKVTIKPPPPRQARRYPVEWPVCLGTMRGAIRGEALDVSRDGMFVRPSNALSLDVNLSFSAVLDDGGTPISGRAKVVRHIDQGRATDYGLISGYGLHIVDMARTDYLRWHDFLGRIERRAEKSVLIGATPPRLVELQAGLAAAGYVVSGGTDPGALAELARAEGRLVDACVIDANWLQPPTSSTWIESLFTARKVPCVTTRGDVRRVRATIDKLLAIV